MQIWFHYFNEKNIIYGLLILFSFSALNHWEFEI